jgi:solute carrier family 25 (mitochondrial phosphate transporter), member 3
VQSRWHYLQCALAGAISCSTTHGLMVPLDVMKTTTQTDVSMARMTIMQAFRRITQESGARGFFKGFSAIYSGYFMQGAAKFGFYEYFKGLLASQLPDAYGSNKLPFYIMASGLAEIIASFALTPLEVTKIFMITDPAAKGLNLLESLSAIVRIGGVKALYRGLPLIMLRQVPYTCVKLAGYDLIVEALRGQVLRLETASRDSVTPSPTSSSSSKAAKKVAEATVRAKEHANDVYLQLTSGVLAGLLAATLSHPADVMLSRLCGSTTALTECIIVQSPADVVALLRDIGFRGCLKGLRTRALMTAIITAVQFTLYESSKQAIIDLSYDRRLDLARGKRYVEL